VDGHPPIGWHDAISYLILPILLVISQSVSQRIMQPQQQTTDPAQQQTQAILKFLPLMIGWFSLNVPSGLTLYWITNNFLTTAQSVSPLVVLCDSVSASVGPELGGVDTKSFSKPLCRSS
jgi:YidC/Oxa1 family membrane protein insertase